MTYHTHFISAVSLAIPVNFFLKQTLQISPQMDMLFFSGVAIGSLFPDVDEPNSFVGKSFKPISSLISMFTTHRGFTHNVKGIVSVAVICLTTGIFLKSAQWNLFLLGFFLGYIFHIVGDAMTFSGIRNFCCRKTLKLLPASLRFKTGSLKENLYFAFFFLVTAVEFFLFTA